MASWATLQSLSTKKNSRHNTSVLVVFLHCACICTVLPFDKVDSTARVQQHCGPRQPARYQFLRLREYLVLIYQSSGLKKSIKGTLSAYLLVF